METPRPSSPRPPRRGLPARLLAAIVVVITAPLWIVAAALFLAFGGIMALAMAPYGRWRDAQMRSALAREGRVMSWDEVERAAAHGGALVIDYPSLGWAALRVWWTSDVVEYEVPDDDDDLVAATDPQHRGYVERYASPASSSAILVATAHGGAAVKLLEQRITTIMARCPALKQAKLHSALLSKMHVAEDSTPPPTSSRPSADP